jgi:monoamine oxidase
MTNLTRRTLLNALAVGSLVDTSRARAGSEKNDEEYVDVVVIGGGFAGLIAAREIQNARLTTLVIEGRGRLGGRTFTVPAFGHALDLGGTWIGPQQPHVWAECTRYGIDVVENAISTTVDPVMIWPRKGKFVRTTADEYDAIFRAAVERWLEHASEVFPYPWRSELPVDLASLDQLSVGESISRLSISQDKKVLLAAYACDEGHTYSRNMSYVSMLHGLATVAGSLRISEDNTDRFRIAGGSKALLDAVMADSKPRVLLSSRAARIELQSGRYRTHTEDGRVVRSKSVVVAVPLNTLAVIQFDPQLDDDKLASLRKNYAGTGLKVYIRIKGDLPPFSAQGAETLPLSSVWTEYQDSAGQVLVGFGADSKRLNLHDTDAVAEAVRIYDRRIEVADVLGYDWQSDPYSRGTWCTLRPGQFSRDIPALRRPTNGIFFAGADLARSWQGNIDGAIETGIRAGRGAAAHASNV